VAGGAIAGVVVAMLTVNDSIAKWLEKINAETGLSNLLGTNGYYLLGFIFFGLMAFTLYRVGVKKTKLA
jgi:hypothetical protein